MAYIGKQRQKWQGGRKRDACVDMECSAVAALAQFRGKDVFQFFYAADNLDSEVWEERSLSNMAKLSDKDKVALLAMDFAVKIGEEKQDGSM